MKQKMKQVNKQADAIEQDMKSISAVLIEKGESISAAESVTAGLIQLKLASAENASQFFHGGITAYNLGQKYRHLHVNPIHAAQVNCVSQQIAEQMSIAVCTMFSSQWGIGITGYATPVPESEFKLFAYYSICHNGKIVSKGKISAEKDDPEKIQYHFAETIFSKLKEVVKIIK